MSNNNTESRLAVKPETITKLDRVASDYQLSTAEATPFAKTFLLAQAIGQMRELLTPEVMQPIMKLQNTDLGFRTDKDPHVKNRKTGEYNQPYSEAVVKDVLIESTLRGFFPVNNEFNIISGRFYAAKNGVRRKVVQWPGLTDFKDMRGVPATKAGGAIIACHASWKLKGVADSLDVEIAVKTDDYSGVDQILGKAERKQLKLILDRISGEITPDGEVDDLPSAGAAPSAPRAKVPTEKAVAGTATTVPSQTAASGGESSEAPVAQSGAKEPESTAQTSEPDEPMAAEKQLHEMMKAEGITNSELAECLKRFGERVHKGFDGPQDLSDKALLYAMENWQEMVKVIKAERTP